MCLANNFVIIFLNDPFTIKKTHCVILEFTSCSHKKNEKKWPLCSASMIFYTKI
jgi:hypothetical protein